MFVASLDAVTGEATWLASLAEEQREPVATLPGSAMDSWHDTLRVSVAAAGGRLYVAGSFRGEARFGSTVFRFAAGDTDTFVAAIEGGVDATAGTVVWVQTGGGTLRDMFRGVAVGGGLVFAVGDFTGFASWGSANLTSLAFNPRNPQWGFSHDAVRPQPTTNPPAAASRALVSGLQVVVAHEAASGEVRWARRGGGRAWDRATAAVVTPGGELLLAADFYDVADWGGELTLRAPLDVGTHPTASVVALEHDTGRVRWGVAARGASTALGLAACGEGIFLTGSFWNGLAFPGLSGEAVSKGEDDAYLARFSLEGRVSWLRAGGGTYTDDAAAVACDDPSPGDPGTGMLYLVGYFFGSMGFGGAAAVVDPPGARPGAAFVARLARDGGPLAATVGGRPVPTPPPSRAATVPPSEIPLATATATGEARTEAETKGSHLVVGFLLCTALTACLYLCYTQGVRRGWVRESAASYSVVSTVIVPPLEDEDEEGVDAVLHSFDLPPEPTSLEEAVVDVPEGEGLSRAGRPSQGVLQGFDVLLDVPEEFELTRNPASSATGEVPAGVEQIPEACAAASASVVTGV